MRNIALVVRDLYELIPDDSEEERFNKLKHNIKKNIINSIPYSDYNMIYKSSLFWKKLSAYVNDSITQEDYKNIMWCKTFIDIFQDPYYKINDTSYHYTPQIENES